MAKNNIESFVNNTPQFWRGIVKDVKKAPSFLQPIYEAFTNSLESIKIRQKVEKNFEQKITITLHLNTTLVDDDFEYKSLSVEDTGIGFNDEQFNRFKTFKDYRKGFNNLGSGRIQFVHFFDETIIESFYTQDSKYFERKFTVSKKESFLKENAIIYNVINNESSAKSLSTKLTFKNPISHNDSFNKLNIIVLKEKILERYLQYFSINHTNLPKIKLEQFIDGNFDYDITIINTDIPIIDKSEQMRIHYKKVSQEGKYEDMLDKSEEFTIDAFKIQDKKLKENNIKLTSKGELITESKILIDNFIKDTQIDGNNFLFLISSEYFDKNDIDRRGTLNIPQKIKKGKTLDAFNDEMIFLDDIQESAIIKITQMYPEFEQKKQLQNEQIEKLKELFLLDKEIEKDLKISVNDSESKILEKFYEAEAKKIAEIDASIKKSLDDLNQIDTTAKNYTEILKYKVEKLAREIPQHNKNTLTRYIARRKIVLELFSKVLDRELDIQKTGREKNEALIHDLLFKQGSSNPENSDLWIINEDFIYFKGNSNIPLKNVQIDNELMFKDEFSFEEDRYLKSLGVNRKIKKPDVLLFPEEGKCIIIEFKNPDVNVSEHLTQIDTYANLILNYTKDKFRIDTFYGYLIGESIEARDVRAANPAYQVSYQFDYLFRPSSPVAGFDGRTDGTIYSEVIKYSTLLDRAKQRNKVFIEKLQDN